MPPKKSRKRSGRNPDAAAPNTNSATTPNQAANRTSNRNPRTKGKSSKASHPGNVASPSNVTKPPNAEESSVSVCPICAEPARDWAVGHCSHVVCGDCSHRMRVLYGRKTCAMCNTELRQVIIVPIKDYQPDMVFETAVALPGAFHDKTVDMWFLERSRHQQLKNFRGWKCSHKACNRKGAKEVVFPNSAMLKAHARNIHRSVYCEICFSGKQCFVSELRTYPLDHDRNYSSRLRAHLRKDHPQCKFCRKHFLDDEKLYAHLQEKHETCFICERAGRMHEYFRNFEELENHYRKEHYVCTHENCRGVVFASAIELQTHLHTRHGENSRGQRGRALRVNLHQLHGERDTDHRNHESPGSVRIEQERQAARRQAFLSSNVVFSGAPTFDENPTQGGGEASSSHQPNNAGNSEQANGTRGNRITPVPIRAPDDGHFHPLPLPRNSDEMQERNTALVRRMRAGLDPAAYEQFRTSSGEFRTGKISAEQYYDAVTDAFGVRAAVRDILPELVALLPTPLLREPLLRTCLERTDTKLNSIETFEASGSAAGSSNQAQTDSEFPTLNGQVAPTRARPQPVRRFGAPGPEDFPRLNRVYKTEGNASASSSNAPSSSAQPNAGPSRTPARRPAPRASTAGAPPQRTAASVLRQTTAPQPSSGVPGRRVPSNHGAMAPAVNLSNTAFPALSAAPTPAQASASSSTQLSTRQTSGVGSSTIVENHPNPDVSLRAGAVWGGAATRGRGGKKRGPGRGRRPATPPRSVIQSSMAIPELRISTDARGSESSDMANGSGSGRKPKVIDVVDIAKSRRTALQKSSLPKVGGSGYGFAWERRKAQQKKKQIKNYMKEAGDKNRDQRTTNSNGVGVQALSNGNQAPDVSDSQTSDMQGLQESGDKLELSSTASTSEVVESSGSRRAETEHVDPYAYMKRGEQDESVVSFFSS